jgi:YggT family protein
VAATVLRLVSFIFWAYRLLIIVRALLPWFGVGYRHPVMAFLIRVTEPVLGPLRRAFPPAGGIDYTPLVALFLLWAIERLVTAMALALL